MTIQPRLWKRPEQGSVAVELAIILPIFLTLLSGPLFLACVFWFYSVGQKAAHDAARYLSTATQAEMRTAGGGFNEAAVAATARWIAQQELVGILPLTDSILIDIKCNNVACGAAVPTTVHVDIQISMHDPILNDLTAKYIGDTNLLLASSVTLRYVGG
jgi:cbb3-type cytochrome oxidase subunit 3